MELSDYLLDIATGYDREAGLSAPAQLTLRQAPYLLSEHIPGGIEIIGSGGKGVATFTPWVGFLDPDETTSPREGVYLVYLFSEDLTAVSLTLNQGIERMREEVGDAVARSRIAADAKAIREALPRNLLDGLNPSLALGSKGQRQRAYEAGNIASIRYEVEALPDESILEADLVRLLDLYQYAVEAKRHLLQASPGTISSASVLQAQDAADVLINFKPKDDSDYVAMISGRVLVKSRRHETLVGQYGEWASAHGFQPSTAEHPKDLVLRKDDAEWLIEAKVVYGGKAAHAVRGALGQLFEYRHFLSIDRPPRLVALFSENVGAAYTSFLETCDIASVWKSSIGWDGSSVAKAAGLADQAP